jgi:hypothetical protein
MNPRFILSSVVLAFSASCLSDGSSPIDAGAIAASKALALYFNGCISLPESGPLNCAAMACPGSTSASRLVAFDLKDSPTGATSAQFFGCSCRTGTSTLTQFDYLAFTVQFGQESISGEHLSGWAAVTGPQPAGDLDSCPTPANGARADLYATFYGQAKINQASAALTRFQGGNVHYSGRSNYYHSDSDTVPPRFTGASPALFVISPP